ncbi:unnamed protein product [Prorocentrum cordatum]|uniref:Uncharacterized protein n=1 Tax=Prorocentrum cordatum TaxID=2364126 RepID=A0ABN9PQT8_9DINO|nr:unnamed protein product [Polarella glacialis]
MPPPLRPCSARAATPPSMLFLPGKRRSPERALAGASLVTFAELAWQRFGEALPKKVADFAKGVAGVSVWNTNGTPYVYPCEVFKLLRRFSESDIERLHKSSSSVVAVCAGCSCPRSAGQEDPNDRVWRCVGCFIDWYGCYL